MLEGVRYWKRGGLWWRTLTQEEQKEFPHQDRVICRAPDPEGIGDGYRTLKVGEERMPGDEWETGLGWLPIEASCYGVPVHKSTVYRLRRPLENWPLRAPDPNIFSFFLGVIEYVQREESHGPAPALRTTTEEERDSNPPRGHCSGSDRDSDRGDTREPAPQTLGEAIEQAILNAKKAWEEGRALAT